MKLDALGRAEAALATTPRLLNQHARAAARRIGRALRELFASRRETVVPVLASRAAAEIASGVEGASWVWCSCGAPLAPIVHSNGTQAEVVALACSRGCETALAVQLGVLVETSIRGACAF